MAVAIASITSSPAIHDAALGNVMALFAAAVAVSLADRGWGGSGTLGVTCAVALKPALGPYLLWLLVRRRGSFGRAFAAGLATTALFAILLGPGRYLEYLQALPKTAVLAAPFTGNLGLSAISPALAIGGMAFASPRRPGAASRPAQRPAAAASPPRRQPAQPRSG